jgi:hypothetical protein
MYDGQSRRNRDIKGPFFRSLHGVITAGFAANPAVRRGNA